HEAAPPKLARERAVIAAGASDRPAPPVAPERFAVLQALLAHLLAACGDSRNARLDADELADRFHIPRDELQEHLSLLNLVNFGGGCYTVYAELEGDTVRVDKELYGDVFRLAPRLTPLEARAIRLALDIVGPTIAARVHTPLDRVRHKLEETFGQFEDHQTPEPREEGDEEQLVATLSDAIEQRRVVAIEYLKEGEEMRSERLVEPYTFERVLPHWLIHTWDRTAAGERSFRLDRMRSARLTDETFEPREGFDPHFLVDTRPVRVRYAKPIARYRIERGATPLTDGAAIGTVWIGAHDWLIGEILADRGEAVVIEPEDLRPAIAKRAAELLRELRLTRVKLPG
ncbi:MAG: WYL domain-containing protein, partial [Actinobacteria bacterium]|nr:WYL domain-containing protein [Actinomycetota bacterium]